MHTVCTSWRGEGGGGRRGTTTASENTRRRSREGKNEEREGRSGGGEEVERKKRRKRSGGSKWWWPVSFFGTFPSYFSFFFSPSLSPSLSRYPSFVSIPLLVYWIYYMTNLAAHKPFAQPRKCTPWLHVSACYSLLLSQQWNTRLLHVNEEEKREDRSEEDRKEDRCRLFRGRVSRTPSIYIYI